MAITFKVITYQQARQEFFAKQVRRSIRTLERHVAAMANDTVNAYDYAAQDKASTLGWNASFYNDAQRVFSNDWQKDFGTICICAVRYSLGRETYMPNLVQTFIADNINMIDDGTLEIMIRDIKQHGGCLNENRAYGADYDYRDWMAFKAKLEEEAARRK